LNKHPDARLVLPGDSYDIANHNSIDMAVAAARISRRLEKSKPFR
jgi:hypothetical protein